MALKAGHCPSKSYWLSSSFILWNSISLQEPGSQTDFHHSWSCSKAFASRQAQLHATDLSRHLGLCVSGHVFLDRLQQPRNQGLCLGHASTWDAAVCELPSEPHLPGEPAGHTDQDSRVQSHAQVPNAAR